ncbi:L-aspartate oxidase [Alkalicoccus luteus]|uniref:L-aspartate oxidase n=1 Tax=Alkalicoccus luteus TaxID=1237094 RepID=A0A969TS55_9BACI|nr:FAD-binding protein [Alkalicoccus luteus]NJP36218.1 FAD-binding protein [Alkalicoccus luteus]
MNVIVIGGGLAACSALANLPKEATCTVLIKHDQHTGNSYLAQGGVAAPFHPDDSIEQHWLDTMECGSWKNNGTRVRELIRDGKELLAAKLYVFDRQPDGALSLATEGAHALPRVLHAGGDQTGARLMKQAARVLEEAHVLEQAQAEDLLVEHGRCTGVVYRHRGERLQLRADAVVLASGGSGSLFPYTSNAPGTTGDAAAMAHRAGMQLEDMEYLQFHPTLWTEKGQTIQLISEAVRGAGATLLREDGTKLMQAAGGDLAPRDVTARAVDQERQQGRSVWLDVSGVDQLSKRFPFLYLEMKRRRSGPLLPVAAGAHFHMGGIPADLDGRTALPGLFAIGEAACTGVHGANRLASNSLLEALVTGTRCGNALREESVPGLSGSIKLTSPLPAEAPDVQELQRHIHEGLGVVRNNTALDGLLDYLRSFSPALEKTTALETANMIDTATLMAIAARENDTPLGAHWKENAYEPTAFTRTADPVFK